MKNSKTSIWAICSLAAVAALGGCRGENSEILATVNGDSITVDTFNKYLGVKTSCRVIVQGQVVDLPVADTLAFQAMQDLVSRAVLEQMAKDEGVQPTPAQIESEI